MRRLFYRGIFISSTITKPGHCIYGSTAGERGCLNIHRRNSHENSWKCVQNRKLSRICTHNEGLFEAFSIEKRKNHMTQQVYLRNGDLRMNEYTFILLQWLKMRVYLYAAKTLHFTRVYNLKKICDLYTFLLYMEGVQRCKGHRPDKPALIFVSLDTLHLQK